MALPDLDTRCSTYFTYRNLIECGETWTRLVEEGRPIANLPERDETWRGLERLADEVLDPLHDRFRRVQLTYGFASPALSRRIPARVAPRLDQHAGAELTARGHLVCARGGQAVDLVIPGIDSIDVALWIRDNVPFDRLYVYGADRALHVSYATAGSRAMFAMVEHGGRRIPRAAAGVDAHAIRRLLAVR